MKHTLRVLSLKKKDGVVWYVLMIQFNLPRVFYFFFTVCFVQSIDFISL
jgi:hypothetical protein